MAHSAPGPMAHSSMVVVVTTVVVVVEICGGCCSGGYGDDAGYGGGSGWSSKVPAPAPVISIYKLQKIDGILFWDVNR